MESLSLLPDLQALPSIKGAGELAPAEMMSRVRAMDRDNFAIEVSIAVEEGLEALFDARNVDDDLAKAWSIVYPNVDHESLHAHFLEIVARGEKSVTSFINPLKGRLAEFKAESVLTELYPRWSFTRAPSPTQQGWDLRGIGPEGQEKLFQVKTGDTSYVGDVLERMNESPDSAFPLSSNLFDEVMEKAPELSDRLINLGVGNHEFTTRLERVWEHWRRTWASTFPTRSERCCRTSARSCLASGSFTALSPRSGRSRARHCPTAPACMACERWR